jgi:hypothetical protein
MLRVRALGNEWDNRNLRPDFAFSKKDLYFNRLLDSKATYEEMLLVRSGLPKQSTKAERNNNLSNYLRGWIE